MAADCINSPQLKIVMAYAKRIGRKEAAKLAALLLAGAVVTGVITTAVVGPLRLDLPYIYSPDQWLRWPS